MYTFNTVHAKITSILESVLHYMIWMRRVVFFLTPKFYHNIKKDDIRLKNSLNFIIETFILEFSNLNIFA